MNTLLSSGRSAGSDVQIGPMLTPTHVHSSADAQYLLLLLSVRSARATGGGRGTAGRTHQEKSMLSAIALVIWRAMVQKMVSAPTAKTTTSASRFLRLI